MRYLFSERQKRIRKRIIEICYKRKYTHIGSCLSAVDIIDEIYKVKKTNERFVLSNGHAGVALYVVLEANGIITSETAESLNIHPDRNSRYGIDVSSGSLGQGLPIAVGMALANRRKNVYCLISDGECAEGSIMEALKIAYIEKLNNLSVIVNANGWGGYGQISLSYLIHIIEGFGYNVEVIDGHDSEKISQSLKQRSKDIPNLVFAETKSDQLPFLNGVDAHYYLMNDVDYKTALELLE